MKAVRSLFLEGHRACKLIKEGFRVVVGNGERAKLWEDIKWENIPLERAFPRLFALSSNKEGFVKDYGRREGSRWIWNVVLRRPVFDWEID
ncbi:hypothetical protein Ddye_005921 [Dipteronia dyeriana]|uniref:Uncharacterized protein n=1 Tax=Dipteronia dyeriana TaxID=168575 RepID=A0AAD9XHF2_9ROSI|nr:hypothetical protein Ddye_005921 [Dipteronia dyeriana]